MQNSIRNRLQSVSLVEFVSQIRIDLHFYEITTRPAKIISIWFIVLCLLKVTTLYLYFWQVHITDQTRFHALISDCKDTSRQKMLSQCSATEYTVSIMT